MVKITFLGGCRKTHKVIAKYVEVIVGTSPKPSKYILTKLGEIAVSLIYHFRDFYAKL